MGKNTQLNLGIICIQKTVFFTFGNKYLSKFSAQFQTNGDILQIWLSRADAPRGSNRLIKGRIDFLSFFIHYSQKPIGIGAF
ncbi:hypothetical protein SDC9_134228 [bioreactor metagenome]|uniref:Uncharacterized protein n=1 Tax=bioreactor metagenome TaxID=1076179 RepID=A0A645DD59_9ZZZZ